MRRAMGTQRAGGQSRQRFRQHWNPTRRPGNHHHQFSYHAAASRHDHRRRALFREGTVEHERNFRRDSLWSDHAGELRREPSAVEERTRDRAVPGTPRRRHRATAGSGSIAADLEHEIITYVLEGAVEHRDSLGTRSVIPAGDVQRMTAGTGIQHSEFNPSPKQSLHLLQIWILPEAAGIKPGYEQKTLGDRTKGRLSLVASHAGGDGALRIHQDADLYIGALDGGRSLDKDLAAGRKAYVHVSRGKVNLNGVALAEGDGAKIADESRLKFAAPEDAEVLLFDLP